MGIYMINPSAFFKKLQPAVSVSPNRYAACIPPFNIKWVAWVTLLLQLFTLLSVPFSPAIAAMKASATATRLSTETTPYVLGAGETVNTVAKKYGLTVDQLKK
jgi:adhesin/invasin